jgi:hypothetical protein
MEIGRIAFSNCQPVPVFGWQPPAQRMVERIQHSCGKWTEPHNFCSHCGANLRGPQTVEEQVAILTSIFGCGPTQS